MKQQSLLTLQSLSATGWELATKCTRKRIFLAQMNLVVRWSELVDLILSYVPTGKMGRPPFAIETMLRIHFMQHWFGLSDLAMEEALHDVPLYREFVQQGPREGLHKSLHSAS